MNASGNFHVDVGRNHAQQPQYAQPIPPQYGYQATSGYQSHTDPYQSPSAAAHPEPGRTMSGSKASGRSHYAVPEKYKYAEVPQQITYVSKPDDRKKSYVQTPHAQIEVETRRPSSHVGHEQEHHRVSHMGIEAHRPSHVELEQERRKVSHVEFETRRPSHVEHKPERPAYVEVNDHRRRPSHSHGAQVIEVQPGGNALHGPPSPRLGAHMHRLSVSGGASSALTLAAPGLSHGNHHGGPPPGSPLLEAYHGTYQSISPMPSPMMLPSSMDDGLSDLEPLEGRSSSDDSQGRRPKKSILKKRVVIYDPEPDALALGGALTHPKRDCEPILSILPRLTDDHMMALRTEYKKHIKVGGKGINIAKHIKLKVPGNLGKIAYATALGRWEGEAYWANFWYQSGNSRRELLIESLMGRTNSEIRAIKLAFSDKRYNDNLEKCMETELKKDKFRYAVLLALKEKRAEELTPVSRTKIREDVSDLYKALVAREGGETAMIDIIVIRSDSHLREVLQDFEVKYRKNFAREMIQKSRNLVV